MEYGRLSETVYERSVYKVIHTTEYQTQTLDGAGLGTDCAILPMGDAMLASAQGQAYGTPTDESVAARALIHALNRLAVYGIFREKADITAQLNVSLAQTDEEPFFRAIIRRAAQTARQYDVAVTGVEATVVPALAAPFVTVYLNAHTRPNMTYFHSDGAPDQTIVMTKWLGLEGTALIAAAMIAVSQRDELAARYPLGLLEDAADFERYLSILPEAACAAQSGVSAMQLVREGGIYAALWNLAESNGVGLVADLKQLPVKQETIELCEYYDANPYELLSGGSLLMLTTDSTHLLAALAAQDIPATVIGRTTADNDRILLNDDEKRYLEPSRRDSIYQILTRYRN